VDKVVLASAPQGVVAGHASYRCFRPRPCENAACYFGKRKFIYLRVPRWPKSGFQLEKIHVSAQVASDRGN
jgi:hypothetical protein